MFPSDWQIFLAARDYYVSPRAFQGQWGRSLHYVSNARSDRREKPSVQCFVDAVTGDWSAWGSGSYRPWESGPWHELAEPAVERSFLDEAIAAGFLPTGSMNQCGNVSGQYDGRYVIASTRTREFICRVQTVDAFRRLADIPTQTRARALAPEFRSMREMPVAPSGRNRQTTLWD